MRKSIKDDEIYGPIRAEICDAYIVDGKPKPERKWLVVAWAGILDECDFSPFAWCSDF
jgi:hypothetical protein